MDGQTAGPALPLAFADAIAGTDQTTGGTAGVWQTINFNTNSSDNVLNGLIDRPTASQFRALLPGYYRYSYTGTAGFANNQRGGLFRILRNGTTEIQGSQAAVFASSGGITKAGSASEEGIILLAANDYIELQANPHGASAMTVYSISSFLFQLVRLT